MIRPWIRQQCDIRAFIATNSATGADRDKPAFWVDGNIHAAELAQLEQVRTRLRIGAQQVSELVVARERVEAGIGQRGTFCHR